MKSETKSQKSTWITYIINKIKKNQNFVGLVTGQPGSGKTFSCLSIAEQLDEELNHNFGGHLICMTPLEFLEQLDEDHPKGTIFILEELGVNASNRKWQSAFNQALNLVLQTFRYKNYIVLANVPHEDFVDSAIRKLVHAHFEMQGFDPVRKIGICKPLKLEYGGRGKSMKFYYKYLQVTKKTADGYKQIKVKRWEIPLASKQILDIYKKKEDEFKSSVLKSSIETMRNLKREEEAKRNNPIKLSKKQEETLEYLKQGKTVSDLMEIFGVNSTNTIYGHMNALRKKGFTIKKVLDPQTRTVSHYEVE